MTRYYLIRHGETESNKSGILQGHLDVPLSDVGLKQSELVARTLSEVEFDEIWSSDLCRASETAERILAGQRKRHAAAITLDSGLREIHCGILQGKTLAEAEKLWPEVYKELKRDPLNAPRPGGESYMEAYSRAVATFERIRESCRKRTPAPRAVAIVCHGGVIRNLLAYGKGQTVDPGSPSVANCSINVLEDSGDGFTVLTENEVGHLLCMGFDPREKAELYRW